MFFFWGGGGGGGEGTFSACSCDYFLIHRINMCLRAQKNRLFEMVLLITVKTALSGHSKIDKTKVFKTNGSLMKVESVAECSLCCRMLSWSVLQYF